jgi:uncharacterized damage-inducible protein DinB
VAFVTGPSDVVRAMFDHHLWATATLIAHLDGLPRERLDEAIPGTYGSIVLTLSHLLNADARYLLRLTDPDPPPAGEDVARPLAELASELEDHRGRWNGFLDRLDAGTLDASIRSRDDYPDVAHAEGLLMLQAIHHGNDHRTQICSTLGALGLDVPDLDGWEYWIADR